MILTSPRSQLEDLADNVRSALEWIEAGCEVGMYPYVIPFSGAAMAGDERLLPYTVTTRQRVAGTEIAWDQPSKILPIAHDVREAIVAIEAAVDQWLECLGAYGDHLPSRVRSLIWIACAIPVLSAAGHRMPEPARAERVLRRHLPVTRHAALRGLLKTVAYQAS
jgi:hypothetical protein